MKWHSVKEYRPTLHSACTLLRLEKLSDNRFWFLELGEYDSNHWLSWNDKDLVEFDDYKVTHFCIPDPIEIKD